MVMRKANTSHRDAMTPWGRRRRRWLKFVLAALVLLVIASGFVHWRSGIRYDARLAELRARGVPLSEAELYAFHVAGEPDKDIAPYLEEARHLQKAYSESEAGEAREAGLWEKLGEESWDAPFSQVLLALLRAHLDANAEALQLLHQAADEPAAFYALDLKKASEQIREAFGQIGEGSHLLRLEAFVAAEEGDSERALQAMLAIAALAQVFRDIPDSTAQLSQNFRRNLIVDALAHSLAVTTFSDDQLERLAIALEHAEDPDALKKALLGENVSILDVYRKPEKTAEYFMVPERYAGFWRFAAHSADITGYNAADRVRYLDFMNEYLAAAELPIEERTSAFRAIANRVRDPNAVLRTPRLSNGFLWSMPQFNSTITRNTADLRTALAVVTIERYRLVAGHPPEELAELVPSFLTEVPRDPFTGEPLRYRRESSGYVVYSVGVNLEDDGGIEADLDDTSYRTDDRIFRVLR